MFSDKRLQPVIQFAPEICAFCSGVGSGRCRDGNIYEKCPVCKGSGAVLVAQVAKKCSFCNGMGAGSCRDGYVYALCPVCKGAGWAYVYDEEEFNA